MAKFCGLNITRKNSRQTRRIIITRIYLVIFSLTIAQVKDFWKILKNCLSNQRRAKMTRLPDKMCKKTHGDRFYRSPW